MKCKAVVFDVYKTLLQVGPPPPNAAERWEFLWQDMLADQPRLSLEEFALACESCIGREHTAARSTGIAHPEIYWPRIALEVLPELVRLSGQQRDAFLYAHAQLQRSVCLMPGAAAVLKALENTPMLLGIASNAQPYTLHEFREALAAEGLTFNIFSPHLCFWSFQAGFSKPDPHVFRWLTARLLADSIAPAEAVMVGDRLDNDILPAQAQGWRTWQLRSSDDPGEILGGSWPAFQAWLKQEQASAMKDPAH